MTPAPMTRWLRPALLAAALTAVPVSVSLAADDAATRKELEQARKELQAAREELARAAREMAKVARKADADSPRAEAYEFMLNPRRALLGVTIADAPETKGQRRGVQVTGVTPGSGADKAGLKAGDLLLSANGTVLSSEGRERPRPTHKLRRLMAELAPGDSVKLEYERAGKKASATVVASRPERMAWQDHEDFDLLLPVPPGTPLVPGAPLPPDAPLPPHPALRAHGGGLQLVRMDADLASYFQTAGGVLVVRVGPGLREGGLDLKAGDVLQSVDGKAIDEPRAAFEALRPDETARAVKLRVLRHGKSVDLAGTLPAGSAMERRIERRIVIEHPEG